MSQSSIAALMKSIKTASPTAGLAHAPTLKRSSAGAAIKRCRAAWQHTFDLALIAYRNNGQNENGAKYDAVKDAAKAYRGAMPVLSGYEGIRDYIACVAHGILIGTIPDEKSGQLLYAAQVAIGSLSHQPKPQKAPKKGAPLPPGTSKRQGR